jgi:hypothetical protein
VAATRNSSRKAGIPIIAPAAIVKPICHSRKGQSLLERVDVVLCGDLCAEAPLSAATAVIGGFPQGGSADSKRWCCATIARTCSSIPVWMVSVCPIMYRAGW